MRATIRIFACLLVLIVGVAVEGRAQGFQGGVRGVVKDSGGVIPGAEVTLTNQGTSLSRSTTTTEAGEYSFPNLAPGTYRLKIVLQGYKTYAQESIPVGTQQFITLDITLEVGTMAETVTVTGQSPIIETSNASTGTMLNAEDSADAALAGARRVHDRQYRPNRCAVGRRAVQQATGSDQRLARLAGGRHPPRQQLHARRRADHRHAQPRERAPVDRIARGHEGAGAHLRRGNGPHGRRRVQHDAEVRDERLSRVGLLPDPADLGTVEQLLR